MATIKKKIWPEYFDAVVSGKKNYELRLNDFEVNEGDTLVLEEWDPATKAYTGRSVGKKATHVLKFTIDKLFWPESEIKEKGLQIISLESTSQRPKVGIGVMVVKDGKALLGKRKGSHGEGQYAWPGGHMEYMESFEECAKREIMEETGMEIQNVKFLRLYNLKSYAPKHYVDIGLVAEWKSGEPKVMEPEKCEGWGWYDMDKLPTPYFDTVPSFVEAYRTGRDYWDF